MPRFLLLFDIELVSELASEAVEGVRRALNWESGALGHFTAPASVSSSVKWPFPFLPLLKLV